MQPHDRYIIAILTVIAIVVAAVGFGLWFLFVR